LAKRETMTVSGSGGLGSSGRLYNARTLSGDDRSDEMAWDNGRGDSETSSGRLTAEGGDIPEPSPHAQREQRERARSFSDENAHGDSAAEAPAEPVVRPSSGAGYQATAQGTSSSDAVTGNSRYGNDGRERRESRDRPVSRERDRGERLARIMGQGQMSQEQRPLRSERSADDSAAHAASVSRTHAQAPGRTSSNDAIIERGNSRSDRLMTKRTSSSDTVTERYGRGNERSGTDGRESRESRDNAQGQQQQTATTASSATRAGPTQSNSGGSPGDAAAVPSSAQGLFSVPREESSLRGESTTSASNELKQHRRSSLPSSSSLSNTGVRSGPGGPLMAGDDPVSPLSMMRARAAVLPGDKSQV